MPIDQNASELRAVPFSGTPVIRLRRHALLALLGLLGLFGLYHLAVQPALSQLVTGVPFINSYGRQRMLSQRLTKAVLASQYSLSEQDRRSRVDELSESLTEWSQQHHALVTRDSRYLRSAEIDRAVEILNGHFANMKRTASRCLELLKSPEGDSGDLKSLTIELLNEEPRFLDQMNRIVDLYQAEVERRAWELRQTGWVIFGLMVGVALFMHLRVVSPAIQVLASLYESNASRYRTLVENMNEGLALVDRVGTVRFANRRLLEMLGVMEANFIGERMDDFLVPQPGARTCFLEALQHQGVLESRFTRSNDSNPLDAMVRCQMVLEPESEEEPVVLVVLTDITEEKQSRERLKEVRTQLTHVNRLKTVGEMTAGLTHELAQPLGAISAFVGSCRNKILQGQTSEEALLPQLERIELAANRAGEILRRFRRFGKNGAMVIQPLNFVELVAEVEQLCQPMLTEHHARLSTTVFPALPVISGDALLIQQVLINLIQNGIQSLGNFGEQRRTLDLRLEPRESEKGIEITLIDRGAGIPAEVMPRLLESFFTTRADGLGLGLPICRSIIEDHGGHLSFSSEEGVGTTVRIILPDESREAIHA